MAFIHHSTLTPTKVELLNGWLPGRPWYTGQGRPELVKSGGFRLDDPEGEVGIEFMVATDVSGQSPQAYFVPLTFRGAPLEGAEHALIGTMEHGVLGTRWTYDGCHDPVLVSELLSLIQGRAQAVAQSITDTPDPEVVRAYTGAPFAFDLFAPQPVDDRDGTRIPTPSGRVLHVRRALEAVSGPVAPPVPKALGHVARGWQSPDGEKAAAVFVTLHDA
jgi:hypothetical protein